MQEIFRFLLAPFALLYSFIAWLRNKFFDWGVFHSMQFDVPTISIGNLTVGGTGKTPHIEYLIRLLLKSNYSPATLSRGYGRKTSGFVLADMNSTSKDIGDEPRMFKQKFPFIPVGVVENRVLGVPNLLMSSPNTQVVLLDDAFQHRSLKPHLNILLTEYGNLFTRDYVLPIGRLRESRKGYKRANMIVVTKSPEKISIQEKQKIIAEIIPTERQRVYFSHLVYGNSYSLLLPDFKLNLNANMDVLLVCGIARPEKLISYLQTKVKNVYVRKFEDHHEYSIDELYTLEETFGNLQSKEKVIITTEKDAMRLMEFRSWIAENNLPVYVLPVEVKFHPDDEEKFNNHILYFMEKIMNGTNG